MIKKLHGYIIKSFIGPWLASFFIGVFLLLMQFLWKYIDDLVGKGLEWHIIAELLFYASLTLVPLALPVSILLATIMTYGGLGEKYELFAMKSGGVSLIRIIYPLFILNLFISLGAFYFSNNLLPYTNLKMRTLLYSIQQQRPEVNLQSGIFTEPVDDFVIKVDRKLRRDNALESVIIYDHRNKSGNTNVTTSNYGNLKTSADEKILIFDLYDGYRYEELESRKTSEKKTRTYPHQKSFFKQKTVFIELDGLGLDRSDEELFKSGFEMLNNKQLILATDSLHEKLRNRESSISNNIVEYNLFKAKDISSKENKTEYSEEKNIINENDSVIEKKSITYINIDSLYNTLNESQKNKVIDFALNYGRSASTYIGAVKDEITGYKRWIARHDIEYHRKYVVAVACILFFLLGAPLGAIIRKGGFGIPVIVSVFIFLFYYIISITFEKMVRELVITPETGMWASSLILLPVTIYILNKATKDSISLSPQFYQTIINKFKRSEDKPILQ